MKKLFFLSSTILMVTVVGCKKSSTSTTIDCSATTPTFAANVQPLIASSCATSGCHAAASRSIPLTNYAQINAAKSSIKSQVSSGSMPQGSSFTTAQKQTIICWIDAGAQNN